MKVKSRNFKKYDAIDRDELFMALHEMYKKGFDFQLTNEEIKELKAATEHFNSYSLEYELITKHYRAGNTNWTTSDIKVQLEKITGQKLNLNKIGQELIRLGYKKVSTNIDVGTGVKQSRQVYKLELLTEFDKPKEVTEDVKEDLPF
jgi:predicted P-loop ATPase